jgi:hypothetical protein
VTYVKPIAPPTTIALLTGWFHSLGVASYQIQVTAARISGAPLRFRIKIRATTAGSAGFSCRRQGSRHHTIKLSLILAAALSVVE